MSRWVVLAAGIVMQTVLGGVYAWSVFVPSLTESYGMSAGRCGLIFGTTIMVFTLATIPAGRLLQRRGPRVTACVGAALFSAGYLIAGYSQGSYPLMLAGIGVVMGAGIGFGYVCPLTVGMKWFPANRGLVTGVSVAGFGAGAVLLSALAERLLGAAGMHVLAVFRVVGVALGGLVFVAALFMREPKNAATRSDPASEDIRSHLARPVFRFICLGMFAGTFAGLLTVSNLKPLCLTMGLTAAEAALSISLFAVGNAAGRVLWGQFHDRLGCRRAIIMSLAVLGAGMTLLLAPLEPALVLAATAVIGFGFGGCFVVYASSIVDHFGVDLFPRLYPVCFLGYGLAGLAGPAAGGWIADVSGLYSGAVAFGAAVVFASVAVVYWGIEDLGKVHA